MMPLIRVQSKLYGSFIIRTTYCLSVLVTYSYCHLISQTRNPYSIVLIILHGSIQGSSPEFLPKSRSIQPLRTQNLLSFHDVNVIE
jgi:hypothetical protein